MIRRSFFLFAGLLVAAGCASDNAGAPAGGEDAMPTRNEDAGPRAGCTTDFECGDGQICDQGTCRAGQCNLDRSCPAGQQCDRATFTCSGSQERSCQEHADCVGAGYCIGEMCKDVACVEDEHCNPGQRCTEQNRCVAKPAECSDGDGDGYGQGCQPGADCDDGDGEVHPGQTENGSTRCDDGVDHDCDGADAVCGETDADGDGVTDKGGDCDDNDPQVNPNAREVAYNGKDDDCDPATRDSDVDGDGYDGCPEGQACDDCNDRNVHINPEARDIPGNGVDEDCDGEDRVPGPQDADGDGTSEADGDCNDDNPDVHPGAVEVPYNGIDDDCTADTPDNDLDRDGFLHPQDCDDHNDAVNPNADEVLYNGADDDCDPATGDGDADGDGFNGGPNGDDCNDEAADVHPGADEVPYNGIDDDCSAETADNDIDHDGFAREDDCDDNDASINPDVEEDFDTNCGDGVDHDCRGGDVACAEVPPPDRDGDGVPDADDCAPDDADIPGPREVPGNGLDDDCDPETPDVVEACDNDAFDDAADNGGREVATAVEDGNTGGVQYGGMIICPGEEDWFQIDLGVGDGLEVDLFFRHADGDIDVTLFRGTAAGELVFVDSSVSVTDNETVYVRRAGEPATYFVRVLGFQAGRAPYGMTANVFQDCTDDAKGPSGEHNDVRGEAKALPPVGENRQICDFDDDWYTFDVAPNGNVRIDLLFPHGAGDLDLELFRQGEAVAIARANSSDDDETIEQQLAAGTYQVHVYGFRGATNRYTLFRSSGQAQRQREEMPAADVDIPEFADGEPGVAEVDLLFADAPDGSVIRSLTIRDLDINHGWLRDLRVVAMWEGVEIAVLWNREGDDNGGDGGLDDDFLPLTGGDINFDNRRYPQFAGLPAVGIFTLRVEDHAARDTGAIVDLDVEIEYSVP